MKKRTRQILALVLVVAFVVAFASISAFAATCPKCGSGDTVSTTQGNRTYYSRVDYCSKYNGVHNHTVTEYYYRFTCRSCGNSFTGSPYTITNKCPYN